jgi:hypothetical protein
VADREYGWTDAGKTSATRHGVTEREVIEALYSPQRDQAVDGGNSMTVHRDPKTMSRDELVAYFDGGGDISELLHGAATGPDLGPTPRPEDVPMIVTGVRLPSATVEQLDALAGRDKGGRSGLIRRAIDEFLERHTGEAA